MHWLSNFGFALFCVAWGVMCGIGISSDVMRWLQRGKQGRKSFAKGLHS